MVSQPPNHAPFLSIASRAYCEHVGMWRHRGPMIGEIAYR